MVGAVGLAPTKAFRPGDLQSPAIATMRYSQKKMAPEVGLEPTTLRLTAACSTIELSRNLFVRTFVTPLIYKKSRKMSIVHKIRLKN